MTAALPALALLLQMGALAGFLYGGRVGVLPRIGGRLRLPVSRRDHFLRWLVRSWLFFGASAVAALLLMGEGAAPLRLPEAFLPLALWTFGWVAPGPASDIAWSIVGGLLGGALIGIGLALWRRRRGRAELRIGNVGALLPRHRGELPWGVALSVTAGITEELFFRCSLPLALALVLGRADVAFVVASLLFGLAHRYQGWAGMVLTTLMGGFSALLYCYTGVLWVPMLVHALVDLNALVLRPLALGAWRGAAAD